MNQFASFTDYIIILDSLTFHTSCIQWQQVFPVLQHSPQYSCFCLDGSNSFLEFQFFQTPLQWSWIFSKYNDGYNYYLCFSSVLWQNLGIFLTSLSLAHFLIHSLSFLLDFSHPHALILSLSLSLIHYCSLPPSLFLATFSLTDSPSLSFTFTIYALTISPFLCKAVEIISSTLIMMGHIVIFFFHDFLSSLGKFRYFHSPSHSLNLSLTHSLSLTLLSLSLSL